MKINRNNRENMEDHAGRKREGEERREELKKRNEKGRVCRDGLTAAHSSYIYKAK